MHAIPSLECGPVTPLVSSELASIWLVVVSVDLFVCTGPMPPYRFASGSYGGLLLALTLASLASFCIAVCPHCNGGTAGCTFDSDAKCPTVTVPGANGRRVVFREIHREIIGKTGEDGVHGPSWPVLAVLARLGPSSAPGIMGGV